jgi:hypothetical protein
MSETGGTPTVLQSPGSSGPLSPSPGSSSSQPGSLTAKSAAVLAWATFAAITYAWLCTSKLDRAPWWGPTAALVANALPGGMLTEIAKTLGLALVDKIPGRGAGK